MDDVTRRWAMELAGSLKRYAIAVARAQTTADAAQAAVESLDQLAVTSTIEQEFADRLATMVNELLYPLQESSRRAFDWASRAALEGVETLAIGHVNRARGRTAIITEQTVRQTETTALAEQYTSLNAALGTTNANVTAIQTAYIAADNALAQDITTVETAVAGNTAAVTTLTQSVDGISARWGVTVSAQGYVNGLVQLDGSTSGSTFTVVADKVQIAQPGVSGGDPVPVFAIGTVNGSTRLALRADMMIDGAILARHLAVSSLSAITANMGTVTAGVIRSSDSKFKIDLDNKTFEILV